MAFEISLNSLKRAIRSVSFARSGDGNEQMYWPLFKERFPNCEVFWREFTVPTGLRPVCHPVMSRVGWSFEPVRLGVATGRGA